MNEQSGEPSEPGLNPLSALSDAYDIMGELRGGVGPSVHVARRRETGTEVLITVVPADALGDNNALGLFAADVNLLTGISHPGIATTIEGRWLDDGSFASVIERPAGKTLAEQLSTDERLGNPQVAVMLRDVSGSLEWARSQGVAHRGVRANAVFVEAGSGRLVIALCATPIPDAGIPGEATDARTIGELARTIFAGGEQSANGDEQSLSSIRPDLAEQVVGAVDAMCSATREALPDVEQFIAAIATADLIKRAEDELAAHRAEFMELLQANRASLESERARWKRRAIQAESRLRSRRVGFALDRREAVAGAAVVLLLATAVFFRLNVRHESAENGAHRAAKSTIAAAATPVKHAPAAEMTTHTAAGSVAPSLVRSAIPPLPSAPDSMPRSASSESETGSPAAPSPTAKSAAMTAVAPAPDSTATKHVVASAPRVKPTVDSTAVRAERDSVRVADSVAVAADSARTRANDTGASRAVDSSGIRAIDSNRARATDSNVARAQEPVRGPGIDSVHVGRADTSLIRGGDTSRLPTNDSSRARSSQPPLTGLRPCNAGDSASGRTARPDSARTDTSRIDTSRSPGHKAPCTPGAGPP